MGGEEGVSMCVGGGGSGRGREGSLYIHSFTTTALFTSWMDILQSAIPDPSNSFGPYSL